MTINDIKPILLINLDDTSLDSALNFYLGNAKVLIKNYLNVDDTVDILATYHEAATQYVIECINKRGNEGLKQFSQGSRSGIYESVLSDSVKALLPIPFVRIG